MPDEPEVRDVNRGGHRDMLCLMLVPQVAPGLRRRQAKVDKCLVDADGQQLRRTLGVPRESTTVMDKTATTGGTNVREEAKNTKHRAVELVFITF